MKAKTQNSKLGIVDVIILSIMGIFALVLPIATKLVSQNQENRSSAKMVEDDNSDYIVPAPKKKTTPKKTSTKTPTKTQLSSITPPPPTIPAPTINQPVVSVDNSKEATFSPEKEVISKQSPTKTSLPSTNPPPPTTICATDTQYKCDGRNLMVCNSDGSQWVLSIECGIDQTCNAASKTCESRTVIIPVTEITLSSSPLTLEVDKSQKISATVSPANATNKQITWSSTDGEIALIDINGTIKALKPGVVTIKATANDDSHVSKSLSINVIEAQADLSSVSTLSANQDKIVSCRDQKGICQPLGECRAVSGTSIGKLDCPGTNICCQIVPLAETEPANCVYDKISYRLGKSICQGNNTSQALCDKDGKWEVKICPYLCNPNTGLCNPSQPCQPDQYKCDGRNLMVCNSDGSQWVLSIECGIDQTCNSSRKTCSSKTENCNPKEDNNLDRVVNSLDVVLCYGKDGVCNPNYHSKTLKEAPTDSEACLKGNVSWLDKQGINGKFQWICISLSDGLTAHCSADKEKGSFGSDCQKNEDCQINGLSLCLENHCMIPGSCISSQIDKEGIKWWQKSICLSSTQSKSNKDQQYTCNNLNNSSNQDFWDFKTIDCPLGCEANGISCIPSGWKCSEFKNIFEHSWWSEFYQDNQKADSLECKFGCDQITGRCNINPESTSSNPLCDAVDGTCFGNLKTCQEEGGTVISKTDCPSPQVCCKMLEEKKEGCVDLDNRKFSEGSSICGQELEAGYLEGDPWMIKCLSGKLTKTYCDHGCLNGVCLKDKNQTCKYNYECQSQICGPEGMCLLKSEGGICQSNSDCQSDNCPFGICLKSGFKCDDKWKKSIDWYFGCKEGQRCTQGECVTDGLCGLANQKDGRTFSSPPTAADNLCKKGQPTTVKTDNNVYSWQCLGEGYLSKKAYCSANQGETNCDGLPVDSKKCGNPQLMLTCTSDGWEINSCVEEESNPGTDYICLENICHPLSANYQPTKEGDICFPARNFNCPTELICDSITYRCLTKDKTTPKTTAADCQKTNYAGTTIFDTDACPEGTSCNRRTEKCDPITTIKNYLRAGSICNNDSQCISNYCQPQTADPNNLSLCNELDQKSYINKGNQNLIIGASVLAAPYAVLAAAPLATSVYYKTASWILTNMAEIAVSSPKLYNFIQKFDTVGDMTDIVIGLAICSQNPNSPECINAQVQLGNPTMYQGLVDEASELFNNAGGVISRNIGEAAQDATQLATRITQETAETGSDIIEETAEVTARLSNDVASELGRDIDSSIFEQAVKYSVDISSPPGVPGSTEVNRQVLQSYLDSIINPNKRDAMEVLAEGVMQQHISHADFISTLENITIPSVNNIIGSDKYIIIVQTGKSNKWVAELSMPSLSPKPVEIFERYTKGEGLYETANNFLVNNPTVRNAVFFDDASYSGSQLGIFASGFQREAERAGINDLKITIAVPYATTVAESLLLNVSGVRLADHITIPTADKVFSLEQQAILSSAGISGFNRTVTTFDHKVADMVSTLDLENYLESYGGFIPNPIIPYKSNLNPL